MSSSRLTRLPGGQEEQARSGSGTVLGWSHEAFSTVEVVVWSIGYRAHWLSAKSSLSLFLAALLLCASASSLY